MSDDRNVRGDRAGTRHLLIGAIVVAVIVLIGGTIWSFFPGTLGTAPGGAPQSATHTADQGSVLTEGRTPAQESAESNVGRANPGGVVTQPGSRAQAIKQSSQPLSLSEDQQKQLRDIIAKQKPPRADQVEFDLQIGVAVPKQTTLQTLPPDVTKVMNGFWGDEYLLVRDKLVIVDQHSRRIVAIVPNVA